jgi:hypothetical protein
MPRYYFDSRDGERFIADESGVELDGIDAARDLAAIGLAELAKDVLPGSVRRELAIEVRDEHREPLLKSFLVFEVERLR